MKTGFRSRVLGAFGALVTALLLVVPSIGAQQGGTVTGRVLDAQSGLPIPAVQIFISSLDLGGLTQQNGRYLLQTVPAGTHTLTVARIGYRTTEVQVAVGGGQTVEQNFQLTEEALQLDEVIVTGTPGGTQRRAIGNTVAVVDVGGITADVAITNFQDLLSGRTTGLRFTRLSGNVGAGSPIQIRGVGSFSLGANPLIYVDGVRVNNDTSAGPNSGGGDNISVLNDFNPEDIESIEVIKGPAAASLYGTEASAGVIQIITKRGSQGAPQFNVSVRTGTNFMTDPATRLGQQWTCAQRSSPGGGINGPCQSKGTLAKYNMYEEANRYIRDGYFDWPTENLYQNGLTQSYNADVAGGSDAIRYFASANYEDQEGTVWYNTDERFRLRANLNVVFSDDFALDVSTGYVDGYTRLAAPTTGDGGVWQDLIWSNGYFLDRLNPFDNSGPGGSSNARLGGFQEHLPSDVADVESTREYDRFTGSATLSHSVGDWLSQRLVIGIDKGWDINRNLFPLEAGPIPLSVTTGNNGGPFPGFDPDAGDTWTSVYSETLDGEMTYERPIVTNTSFDYSVTGDYAPNDNFTFGTSFGVQYYTESTDWFSNSGNGFASPLSRTINQLSTTQLSTTYTFLENKSLGFYIQEQVGYQDRIFLTGSVRFDDNSTFGIDAPSEKYPNFQGTWVLSEESFWNVDAINSFRLRAAWGQAGRQPSATAGFNIFSVIPGPGGASAIRASSPGNPAIEPEVSTELEVGAEFALFNDRISGEFTHYQRTDKNTLLSQAVLSSNGVPGSTQQNLGRIDAWGWETSLSIAVIEGDGWSLDLDLAADYNNNAIRDVGAFGASRTFGKGIQWPRQTNSDLIVSAQIYEGQAAIDCPRTGPPGTVVCDRSNSFGDRFSAMCDAGLSLAPQRLRDGAVDQGLTQAQRDRFQERVDLYGIMPGGEIVPCGEVSSGSHSLGPSFFPYSFRIAPRISLFDNALQITAMAEGLYGKWTDENGIEWGHNYNNTKASRLETDPVWFYGNAIGDLRVKRQYLNNFWKLREFSVRYNVPSSLIGRTGAERASIAFAARNLFLLYRSQNKITGGQISDPEYGSPGISGDGNYWQVPPLASLNLTLRVTF